DGARAANSGFAYHAAPRRRAIPMADCARTSVLERLFSPGNRIILAAGHPGAPLRVEGLPCAWARLAGEAEGLVWACSRRRLRAGYADDATGPPGLPFALCRGRVRIVIGQFAYGRG